MSSLDELTKRLALLEIEKADLTQQIREALGRERKERETGKWTKGDKVIIANRLSAPVGRLADRGDREATITRVEGERIHIVTDNGFHTWRLPKNLRRKN